MDDRVTRLFDKAEAAADRNDLDQAETYRVLASNYDYLRRREAKDMNRVFERD